MTTKIETSISFKNIHTTPNNYAEGGDDFVKRFNQSDYPNGDFKKLEIYLYPTQYDNQAVGRVCTLTADTLGKMDNIRFIIISCDKPFIYALAPSIGALGNAVDMMARTVYIDGGEKPPEGVTEGTEYPNLNNVIRLINPIDVNAGGTGFATTDTPILVTVLVQGTRTIGATT